MGKRNGNLEFWKDRKVAKVEVEAGHRDERIVWKIAGGNNRKSKEYNNGKRLRTK